MELDTRGVLLRYGVYALMVTFLLLGFSLVLLSGGCEGKTIDNKEILPGTPIPIELEDYDESEDVLKITIVFKEQNTEDFEPRGIDILIMDTNQANKIPKYEIAEDMAAKKWENVSFRMEEEVTNTRDAPQSIIFYNHWTWDTPPSDDEYDNATVTLRIDYTVQEATEEENGNFLPLIIGIVVALMVVALLVLLVMFFKRRRNDARTFFNPEEGPYYAFRSMLDDNVYYLDPDQYARLYESNSLGEYEYLGTATKIGGMITPPEGQTVQDESMMGQPMEAVPVEDGDKDMDIASMQATPVSPGTFDQTGQEEGEVATESYDGSGNEKHQDPPKEATEEDAEARKLYDETGYAHQEYPNRDNSDNADQQGSTDNGGTYDDGSVSPGQ